VQYNNLFFFTLTYTLFKTSALFEHATTGMPCFFTVIGCMQSCYRQTETVRRADFTGAYPEHALRERELAKAALKRILQEQGGERDLNTHSAKDADREPIVPEQYEK
jgi:hypothetical protein